jgi:hypothetical protein
MNARKRNHATRSAVAGTSRIERLALALLDEVKRHEAGRRLRNELEMEKFKRQLEGGTP